MKITFTDAAQPKTKDVVIAVYDDLKLGKIATSINSKTASLVQKTIKTKEFEGKRGEVLSLVAPASTSFNSIYILGLGSEKKINELKSQSIGGKIFAALNASKVKDATILVEVGKKNSAQIAANIAYGILLRSYKFDKYKTSNDKKKKAQLSKLTIASNDKTGASSSFKKLEKIAQGVSLSRDLVTEPPNHLHPESYADIIKKEFANLDAKVTILGEKQLEKLGMGALLGVGQGSIRESKVVTIEYNNGKKSDKPVAFVGKGVTFDTGGISLKPSGGMEDMKYDMGGSAAVVGAMKALVGRKAKVNAVGIVGLVENMPGHNAQRPSDVVTAMSGKTIEVLNTDAEGRLVLADVLWYAQTKFKAKTVVNLATLTGAIVVALADQYAGLFSNNDDLSEKLTKAGTESGERIWRFPLGPEYDKMIDSKIADVQNIGNGRGAGSITAAQFLQRFIKDDVAWAHLDIAGMAWTKKALATCPEGATGFGARLLDKFVQNNFG